jgi:hypothetical protein
MTKFSFLLAALIFSAISHGSQSFESFPNKVDVSGYVGRDTYKIIASLSLNEETHYYLENLQVWINEDPLQFPKNEIVMLKKVVVSSIGITYTGAGNYYEVTIPYVSKGSCIDEVENGSWAAFGSYIMRFDGELKYMSSEHQIPENSCPEGLLYEYIE